MMTRVITIALNWVLTAILLPVMAFVYDTWKLRAENKVLKKSIEDLKIAKTKTDIDSAIDKLP